jgi:prophage regulatory protein
MSKTHQTQDSMIRMQELTGIVGLKKTTIYQKMRLGTFPNPVQLSARAVAWKASDIAHWQAALTNGVRTEHAVGNVRSKETKTETAPKGAAQVRLRDALVTLRVFNGEHEMVIENGGDSPIVIAGRESLQRIGLALIKFS